jgi:hypothetical protein
MIDATGDKKAIGLQGTSAAVSTNAEIEALATAIGDASSANVYEVNVNQAYIDTPDKNDAVVAERDEVANVLNILAKHADGRAASLPLLAPIPDLFIANSDEIDPASTELLALFTAFLAVLPAGFEIISCRYSTRHQYNPATPI